MDNAHEKRNDVQDEIYAIMKNYRQVFPSYFVKGHALIATRPRLSPEPGSMPAAVTINVVWDAALGKARISFTASSDANGVRYSMRYCVGTTYSSDDENVIDSIPAGPGPFVYFTHAGLATGGDTISLKVYAINDTDNEKGSNAVAVTRPVGPT